MTQKWYIVCTLLVRDADKILPSDMFCELIYMYMNN